MDTFDGYRRKRLTDVERQAYRNLHRAIVLEQRDGGAHIDTAVRAQCFLCNGACDGNQHCPVLLSQMPSPLEPQPVQISKPSLWQRIVAWYRKHIDNGKVYD